MKNYAELLFINEVLELQNEVGVGDTYARVYKKRIAESLSDQEIDFISQRESFYIASISSTGWPYIQHRGGPQGFLKVIDTNLLGFADYTGNKQFITMGHAARNEKVALFLMDYENSARLKILGHLKMQHAKDADALVCEKLNTEGQGQVERIATIQIESMDWNCPKYIPQLISATKLAPQLQAVIDENEYLKKELAQLKASKK